MILTLQEAIDTCRPKTFNSVMDLYTRGIITAVESSIYLLRLDQDGEEFELPVHSSIKEEFDKLEFADRHKIRIFQWKTTLGVDD
jgi:hypothetical protein